MILPEFWQTKTFLLFCSGAAHGVSIVLYRLRIRRMTVRERARLEVRLLERERIARELHDTLLQGFQGLLIRLQTVLDRIPQEEPAHELLDQAIEHADRVLIEGRDRVRDLRSPGIPHNTLSEALGDSGREFAQASPSVALRITTRGLPRTLCPIVRDEAYWVGREALANAFRHAEPTAVEVDVHYEARMLRIHVRDDGRGIAPGVLQSGGHRGHWGLPGMHERALKIRGRLRIWSRLDIMA